GGGGGSFITCRSVSSLVTPQNGGRPASSSYSSTPSPYTSLAGPTSASRPCACSGDMYVGVPRIAPVSVIVSVPSSRILARPKSVILGSRSEDRESRSGLSFLDP